MAKLTDDNNIQSHRFHEDGAQIEPEGPHSVAQLSDD